MSGVDSSSDEVIAKLIDMGFENSAIMEAVEAIGPSLHGAIEYILNGSLRNPIGKSSSSICSTSDGKTLGKRTLLSASSPGVMRQSSLLDHCQFTTRYKRGKSKAVADLPVSLSMVPSSIVEEHKESCPEMHCRHENKPEFLPVWCPGEVDIGSDWEVKVNSLLKKHFGYSSLKNFQKEALSAWLTHQDCLVLAATGSGITVCFGDVCMFLMSFYLGVVNILVYFTCCREIFVFSDSGFTNEESCGCDFTLDKLDA